MNPPQLLPRSIQDSIQIYQPIYPAGNSEQSVPLPTPALVPHLSSLQKARSILERLPKPANSTDLAKPTYSKDLPKPALHSSNSTDLRKSALHSSHSTDLPKPTHVLHTVSELNSSQKPLPKPKMHHAQKLFVICSFVSIVFVFLTISLTVALRFLLDGPIPTEHCELGEVLIYVSNSLGFLVCYIWIGTELCCKKFYKNGGCGKCIIVFCYIGFFCVIGCNGFTLFALLTIKEKTIVDYVQKYFARYNKIPPNFDLLNVVTKCGTNEANRPETLDNLIIHCADTFLLIVREKAVAKIRFVDVKRLIGKVSYIEGVYWFRNGIIVTLAIVICFFVLCFILFNLFNCKKCGSNRQNRVAPEVLPRETKVYFGVDTDDHDGEIPHKDDGNYNHELDRQDDDDGDEWRSNPYEFLRDPGGQQPNTNTAFPNLQKNPQQPNQNPALPNPQRKSQQPNENPTLPNPQRKSQQPNENPVLPNPQWNPQEPNENPTLPNPQRKSQQPNENPTLPNPQWKPQEPNQDPALPNPQWNPQEPNQNPALPYPQWNPQQPNQNPALPYPQWNPQQPNQNPALPYPQWNLQQPNQNPVLPYPPWNPQQPSPQSITIQLQGPETKVAEMKKTAEPSPPSSPQTTSKPPIAIEQNISRKKSLTAKLREDDDDEDDDEDDDDEPKGSRRRRSKGKKKKHKRKKSKKSKKSKRKSKSR